MATTRADGDLHPTRVDPSVLRARRRAAVDRPWAIAAQVHGTDVWQPDRAIVPPLPIGPEADVVVLERSQRAAVAMWAADCATAVLVTDRRLIGVHAGWRGLAEGVIDVAVEAARGERIHAVVAGPMIEPCCYEFGPDELAQVASGVGVTPDVISGATSGCGLALDVPATLDAAFARHGLAVDDRATGCTGCSGRWFSHRTRVDTGRHALVGWWE